MTILPFPSPVAPPRCTVSPERFGVVPSHQSPVESDGTGAADATESLRPNVLTMPGLEVTYRSLIIEL